MPSPILQSLSPRWYANPLMHGIAAAIARPFDRALRWLRYTIATVFDPETTPADLIDWLAFVVGLPDYPQLTVAKKRALIAVAIDVWANKGTTTGIEEYVRAVTDVTAEVVPVDGLAFVAGVSKAGNVCGVTRPLWSFLVRVPVGSIDVEDLNEVLSPVIPVFCAYTIEFV